MRCSFLSNDFNESKKLRFICRPSASDPKQPGDKTVVMVNDLIQRTITVGHLRYATPTQHELMQGLSCNQCRNQQVLVWLYH